MRPTQSDFGSVMVNSPSERSSVMLSAVKVWILIASAPVSAAASTIASARSSDWLWLPDISAMMKGLPSLAMPWVLLSSSRSVSISSSQIAPSGDVCSPVRRKSSSPDFRSNSGRQSSASTARSSAMAVSGIGASLSVS